MLVYRITLKKYSKKLVASGNAARWNSKRNYVIYTAASSALACLENVVHRGGEGLNNLFKVLIVEIPDDLKIEKVMLSKQQKDWMNFTNYPYSQSIGDAWIAKQISPVLQVPSAIIANESNFLINQNHNDFKKVRVQKVEDFIFDPRLVENKAI
jgi:RES domain-containing protein